MNKEKSGTNSIECAEDAKLIEGTEGYKYLGITEDSESRTKPETMEKLKEKIKERVERLCNTRLNGKNLMKGINEYAISLMNYFVGVIEAEASDYERSDLEIRQILTSKGCHAITGCKERLYLPRDELGRGLHSMELRSEVMMLELRQTLERSKQSLRRKAILKAEKEGQTHLWHIEGFLRAKYGIKDEDNKEINKTTVEEAQKKRLCMNIYFYLILFYKLLHSNNIIQ